MTPQFVAVVLFFTAGISTCTSFSISTPLLRHQSSSTRLEAAVSSSNSRRELLLESLLAGVAILSSGAAVVQPAFAEDTITTTTTTSFIPEITDKIYIDIKSPMDQESMRIVIGLYGKEAPNSTNMLKQIVSASGLAVNCKPRDTTRTFEKEQLEANKVYNSCIENEKKGVNYEYGTIWKIVKGERIDVGAVSGKFISREFPNWNEDTKRKLPIEYGTVTVQQGNESGFGFSIYPGTEDKQSDNNSIVIGRVLEGNLQKLNDFPVVMTSSKFNYMAIVGSSGNRAAPSRACRYGSGEFYCNEFKPLQKLSIVGSGVVL